MARVKGWPLVQAAMVMEQQGLAPEDIGVGMGLPTVRVLGLLMRGRGADDRPLPGVFVMRPKKLRTPRWCDACHRTMTLWAPSGPWCYACLTEWMNEKRKRRG